MNVSSPVTPVPSVCVRVPHSPSYESGGAETPILDSQQYSNYEFTKLHVREFLKTGKKQKLKTRKKYGYVKNLVE